MPKKLLIQNDIVTKKIRYSLNFSHLLISGISENVYEANSPKQSLSLSQSVSQSVSQPVS